MYNFTLYMTTDCNFKCQYCYEDYHNHYQLNEKTLVDSLEFMMNYGDRGKVLIDFLGGEPLLKKDLIYKAVAYIKDNYPERETSVYKGYKQDKIEMRGDRAEMSDFPLYLNMVTGGLDCRDQAIGGFSFVVKIYAVPVVEIIG